MTADYLAIKAQRLGGLKDDAARILQQTNEFTFEVGCGHGHFLTAYAAEHPAQCCIGIDVLAERIERAERKRTRAGLENVHFLRGDARLFLEALPPHARIACVFVLFPDPWPKLRHRKHRLLQPAFLADLAQHATAEAHLYFRTDHTDYYRDAFTVASQHPDWQIVDSPWPFEFETVFQQRAPSFQSFVARRSVPCMPANGANNRQKTRSETNLGS